MGRLLGNGSSTVKWGINRMNRNLSGEQVNFALACIALLLCSSCGSIRHDSGPSREPIIKAYTGPTVFEDYDKGMISSIKENWFREIDKGNYLHLKGVVIMGFNLGANGTIADIKVIKSTAGNDLTSLCQRALLESFPYKPWSEDMRRLLGTDLREVKFTFYYED